MLSGRHQSHDSTVREGLVPLLFCLLEASILRMYLGINPGVQCLLQRSIRARSCPNPGPETRRPTGAARGQEHPLPNETFVGETKETFSLYVHLPWEAGREDRAEGGPPRLRRKPADTCLPRGSCAPTGGPPPPGHLAPNREHRLRKQPCEPRASRLRGSQSVPWDPERRSFHL